MPGAYVHLEGENGSGKTSLLRCIARLHNNSTGVITYNSCDVNEFLNEYKQIILYISDKEQLNNEMTVYEIINFWANLYDADMLLPAAAHTLHLIEYLNHSIKFLSRGLKKRVILSRLLLQRARIWLLDEPFTNLDKNSISILNNIIETHISNGGIAIVTNHIHYESKAIADLENIGYKVNNNSQLEKQKILLKMQDFKCEKN